MPISKVSDVESTGLSSSWFILWLPFWLLGCLGVGDGLRCEDSGYVAGVGEEDVAGDWVVEEDV